MISASVRGMAADEVLLTTADMTRTVEYFRAFLHSLANMFLFDPDEVPSFLFRKPHPEFLDAFLLLGSRRIPDLLLLPRFSV